MRCGIWGEKGEFSLHIMCGDIAIISFKNLKVEIA